MNNVALLIGAGFIALSTNQQSQNTENRTTAKLPPRTEWHMQNPADSSKNGFKIENIPYTTAKLGEMPFFTLPKGLKSMNKPLERDFDVCFFPINGIMTPFEGKLYKINVSAEDGQQFSQRYFEKSMQDYLQSIGATKVYEGKISQDEYQRYDPETTNRGDDGDIGYPDDKIIFYAIRSKEKGNIYVQFTANNAAGKLNILQEEALEQTIETITAEEITKELAEKGKATLYINFDVDKANLTADGKQVVEQIGQALIQDSSLRISIEGHTDNTGKAEHNKKLSTERAHAVMQNLITDGISKDRLEAKGFGAEHPLVDNNSEENKAKNRRVELLKIN